MDEFFFSALFFGLAAGLKPGPLGIVVIQQTLTKGLRSGFYASFAPFITDGPIIIAVLLMLSNFKNIDIFTATLCLIGGLYLIWLSRKILLIKEIDLSKALEKESSLLLAVKINFFNPSPYIFWFTIGGSYILRGNAFQSSIFVFTAIFTLALSKFLVAILAYFFRPALESHGYVLVMKTLAAIMAIFGIHSIYKAYFIFENSSLVL
jgi:threonine/homoserine/homoserine lactone efflux protein